MKLHLQVNRLDSGGVFQASSLHGSITENLDFLHPDNSEAIKRLLHKGYIYFIAIKQCSCLNSFLEGYINSYIMYGKEIHHMHVFLPFFWFGMTILICLSQVSCFIPGLWFGSGRQILYIVLSGSRFILDAETVGVLLSKMYLVTKQIEFEESTAVLQAYLCFWSQLTAFSRYFLSDNICLLTLLKLFIKRSLCHRCSQYLSLHASLCGNLLEVCRKQCLL